MVSCAGVSKPGNNPWVHGAVIATATLSAVTAVVYGILATLVGAHLITLPSMLSMSKLLITGVVIGVFFAACSVAIKYSYSWAQKKAVKEQDTKEELPVNPQVTQESHDKKVKETKKGTKGNKVTPLDPNGKGNTGAVDQSGGQLGFNIHKGKHRGPLDV